MMNTQELDRIIKRAEALVDERPPAKSGQGGNAATFSVASILVHGFGLDAATALPIFKRYNERCEPPWKENELEKMLNNAMNRTYKEKRGHLLEEGAAMEAKPLEPSKAKAKPKPVYDPEKLKRNAGQWAGVVNGVWLANRSTVDPAMVSTVQFLEALYHEGEKVLIFTRTNKTGRPVTQGEALWPQQPAPTSGRHGVWFLPQPVDGEYHINPRAPREEGEEPKQSRRSEESVTAWRYMLIESDKAPLREWLGLIAQIPLRIAAIYSSGGRSVHALVRVDAKTKQHWDDIKGAMAPILEFLVENGADAGVLSAVRLSRLPGCWRAEKGQWQKLLYLNPAPKPVPLIEILPRRDVEQNWLDLADANAAEQDAEHRKFVTNGLQYHARSSEKLRGALTRWASV